MNINGNHCSTQVSETIDMDETISCKLQQLEEQYQLFKKMVDIASKKQITGSDYISDEEGKGLIIASLVQIHEMLEEQIAEIGFHLPYAIGQAIEDVKLQKSFGIDYNTLYSQMQHQKAIDQERIRVLEKKIADVLS